MVESLQLQPFLPVLTILTVICFLLVSYPVLQLMAVNAHSPTTWLMTAEAWLQFLSNIHFHAGESPEVGVPLEMFHLLKL